jgi:hypothetical protein
MGALTKHTGTWTLEDLFASTWHYLPVEVPPGTAALRVTLSCSPGPDGGAIVDLGCLGPEGFRGWSGGARSSFFLSAAGATPGYLPGEVSPGRWQVIIGLHRVPAEGVRFAVTAETASGAVPADWTAGAVTAAGAPLPDGAGGVLLPGAAGGAGAAGAAGAGGAGGVGGAAGPLLAEPLPAGRPARRALPATAGRTWLAGDLHAHTVHSDGALSVAELASLAVERGLDFVAVTDHNTVSHHAALPGVSARYGVTLIPGQEVTTAGGHAGVLGDTGWIDFRSPPDAWLAAAERGGGLMSVNHPFGGDVSWLHAMKRRPPLLEVWHWSWLDPRWTTPLSWWQAWDPAAIPVGGSDWHRPGSDAPLGTPTTWVESVDPSPAAILAALRAGRVTITASRSGPVLLRTDGELVAIGADGLLVADPAGPYRRVRGDFARLPDARAGYHRLVTPAGATLALVP